MRVLLTGSSGQLGKAIQNTIPYEVDMFVPNRNNLNLEDAKDCYEIIKKIKPDWVINSGAYTNVEEAETNKELTLKINSQAPEAFAYALKKYGGKLMQISTDYVFNGEKDIPYEVHDNHDPINFYGKSKSLAEESIRNILTGDNKLNILRTSWLISPTGKNFLLTIMKLLENKKNINVVNDQIGCLTSTFSLSKIIWQLIKKNENYSNIGKIFPTTFHWAENGEITWYQLASKIREICKELKIIDNPSRIFPISTNEYPFKAKRPKYSVLNCKDTEIILDVKRVKWEKSIKKIINEIAYNKL